MKLKSLLNGIKYSIISEGSELADGDCGEIEITDITDNSVECGRGCLFVCIKGAKNDGHEFIADALKGGAAVIVFEKERIEEIRGITASNPYIYFIMVENARSAFAKMCAAYYGIGGSSVKIICVTGTNGKTTVSTIICRALCACGKHAALLGTLGGYFEGESYSSGTMTTPDPKLLYRIIASFVERGAEYVVMEASSHALALDKLDGLDIYLGVFTNLTPEHLDFHGSMDEYGAAKAKLFEKCRSGGVFFSDDPYCARMASALGEGKKTVFCSLRDENADYFAIDVRWLGENGVKYSVLHGNSQGNGLKRHTSRTEIFCGIAGSFSVGNSLLAFAVLHELGVPAVCAAGGIISQGGVRGRMERLALPEKTGFSVFIDFAHTPDALSKTLRSVREFADREQRITVLFGCGGDRDRSKRSLMGAIASRLADMTVLTSDNSRSESAEAIISEILSGFDRSKPYKIIIDRREAIRYALSTATKGDIIMLCGKGHEEYEIVGDRVIPFSERDIVAEFFRETKDGDL
ncbi:MAG: UDP-N-acetylmuramoyl-L-alanyl-D-glutamate--2,6-diaminopimelate ligase [Clostridia bacterium]|nr:UDP-N-acetylmuramoyl-L-alanyl-D-glutamate--2,6-diaminopimelate ligase [Clostridia bacterium]